VEPSKVLLPGSVEDLVARLAQWGRRAGQGLARVEFSSEKARRRVVASLQELYAERNIYFYEITLSDKQSPANMVDFLLEELGKIPPGGVASISGFDAVFSVEILQQRENLVYFNFNRERLANFPVRQIWWLRQSWVNNFIRYLPDLDSWFLLRLSLTETESLEHVASISTLKVDRSPHAHPPHNLPLVSKNFLGREQQLAWLHQSLQAPDSAIFSVVGRGGVGKTQLILFYARQHLVDYPGGICWLSARSGDVGVQILDFARTYLKLEPPQELSLPSQVAFCWQHWLAGEVLVVFDDVLELSEIEAYLPPRDKNFKVLITTRLTGLGLDTLNLDVLETDAALALLSSLIGSKRIEQELVAAKQLCAWLDFSPLGLELVGRYLLEGTDISLANLLERLQQVRLDYRILRSDETSRGVATIFELSWQQLSQDEIGRAHV